MLSYTYYTLAKKQGYNENSEELTEMISDLTAEQIEKSKRVADAWSVDDPLPAANDLIMSH